MSTCGSLVGPLVLVEEAQLRDDGADERQEYAQVQHEIRESEDRETRTTTGSATGPLAKPVPLSIGPQGPRLEYHQTNVQL